MQNSKFNMVTVDSDENRLNASCLEQYAILESKSRGENAW